MVRSSACRQWSGQLRRRGVNGGETASAWNTGEAASADTKYLPDPPLVVFICRDQSNGEEVAPAADPVVTAARAYGGEYPAEWHGSASRSRAFLDPGGSCSLKRAILRHRHRDTPASAPSTPLAAARTGRPVGRLRAAHDGSHDQRVDRTHDSEVRAPEAVVQADYRADGHDGAAVALPC